MDQEYDIFERSGGSLLWRAYETGLEEARLKLQQIANKTTNECFAIHLLTHHIVAIANNTAVPI
jgi:hypothetical protein